MELISSRTETIKINMTLLFKFILFLVTTTFAYTSVHADEVVKISTDDCLIKGDSIAGIKIGMEITVIQEKLGRGSYLKFTNEGSKSSAYVYLEGKKKLWFYSQNGETVHALSTTYSGCKTSQDIGPGSSINDANKVYGKNVRIDSRLTHDRTFEKYDYVEFKKQSRGISYQITKDTITKIRIHKVHATTECSITENSISDIKIGMRIFDVYSSIYRTNKFEFIETGDTSKLLLIYTDSDDELLFAKFNHNDRVSELWTYHPECKTQQNLGPGDLTSFAAKLSSPSDLFTYFNIEKENFGKYLNQPTISYGITKKNMNENNAISTKDDTDKNVKAESIITKVIVESPKFSNSEMINCSITSDSIAGIKLGENTEKLKDIIPNATFHNNKPIGDVNSMSIVLDNIKLLTVYPDEKGKIYYLETSNSECKTENNVHPDILMSEAESILGETDKIHRMGCQVGFDSVSCDATEREYAFTDIQPKSINYIFVGGVFRHNAFTGKNFRPYSYISTIGVGSEPFYKYRKWLDPYASE